MSFDHPGIVPEEPRSSAGSVLDVLQLQRDLYPHLLDEQFGRLQALLLEFVDIFAVDSSALGCVKPEKNFYHRIDTGDAVPVTQKPYKMSHTQSVWLYGELARLQPMKVLQPSTSAWMSPAVPVPKPDGGMRLCVDMRQLNKKSVADPYPLPTHMQGACSYGWL